MSCNCNKNCNHNCNDSCGCSHFHSASCIFYKGNGGGCSGFVYGDTIEEVVDKLDQKLCSISPSGYTTIVNSCSSAITVTSNTVGTETTYTVCLDEGIQEQLDNNTASIASLSTCVSNSIVELVSDTISVTNQEAGDPCGRVWRIEYNPSGTVDVQGVVENNTSVSTTIPNGAGGTQLVKTFNHNYSIDNLLVDGDRIKFWINGEITANGSGITDDVLIELFDATSSTVLDLTTLTGMFTSVGTSSYEVEAVLEVDVTNSQAIYSIKVQSTHNTSNVFTDVVRPKSKSRVLVTGIDYSNLTIRVRQTNSSLLGATNNTVTKLVVEVTKKI